MTVHLPPLAEAGVTLTELPPAARFSLRLRPANRKAAAKGLGVALPERVGGIAEGKGRRALCLGPDEWQIDAAPGDTPDLPADLPHALVEITDREITFRIEGPRAMELLSIGIARDLRRLVPGTGCRTAFDGISAVLVREGEVAFTLAVWRSFAPHVRGVLEVGLRELASGL
ncbi:sarcosine oxidase subunit gamma [Rhodovulum euryhalinum]|uniref:Sarcosine oxidase subunit gamma n=1 Tax=Rhodovulum euryhalinum TaxID=35805 RepID=A0A4R2KD65_9RHOB|nr:sarcosine oxidase subunit gamma [Rhodovulum euryhalinum]TCO70067.1 sarcosine oxidase subunit gamma [Rhodovulum euryhalinum]